jgi:hypothetical protein
LTIATGHRHSRALERPVDFTLDINILGRLVTIMSLDLDLHEAFRLLYDDEEDLDFDADWDEDEDDVQVPMNDAPPAEVEIPSTKYSKVPIAKPVISKL